MQQRSAPRRNSPERTPSRFRSKRFIGAIVAVVAFAGVVAVSQVSDASTRRRNAAAQRACPPATTGAAQQQGAAQQGGATTGANKAPKANATNVPSDVDKPIGDTPEQGQTEGDISGGVQNGRAVRHHVGDGQGTVDRSGRCKPSTGTSSGASASAGASAAPVVPIEDSELLGTSCDTSKLPAHTGFQDANRCVGIEMGEVGAAAKNPTLLITKSPFRVKVNQPFTLSVSTRNLVRDRFLKAAAGGYYRESAYLNAEGLVRGHFHTACRRIPNPNEAPEPDVVPDFFVATEDGGGGARPDTIVVNISGIKTAGLVQCAVWAGDATHRLPMMQRANETPAFDVVRIIVTN